MKIDLHMHSTASDGKLTPEELVDLAVGGGIPVIAVTDHDVLDGSRKAIRYAKDKNIKVVSGVEFGVKSENLKLDGLHVVGLFLDLENKKLIELSEKLVKAREVQKKKIIKKLNNLGYEITFEELQKEAGGVNYVRLHIVRILMRKYSEFESVQSVFDKLLGVSGGAYVEQWMETMKNTVDIIHGAGGVAILAHPMFYDNPKRVVREFIQCGGDGMEVNYCYENRDWGFDDVDKVRSEARRIAGKNGLVVSGGGDFHSRGGPQEIGDFGVNEEEFLNLKKFWKERIL